MVASMTTNAPTLLDADGRASMATAFMMSHHGLRRDAAQFAIALRRVAAGDASRVDALRTEWQSYHGTLHGHHMMEDERIFPDVRSRSPDLATVVDGLASDHRRMDELLAAGDRAFGDLPASAAAASAVLSELGTLLDSHLAAEETHVVPLLRDAREFPPPASPEELAMYADGFAWSSHGIAPEVLAAVYAMLPETVASKIPAARDAFAARCERVWGTSKAGASRTPIPDWIEVA
jgi:hypothetical protein